MTEKKVNKDMMIGEVVSQYPIAARVMMQHGLHCIGCHVAAHESIEQGCRGHGMDDKKVEEMVEEINKEIEEHLKEHSSEQKEPNDKEETA